MTPSRRFLARLRVGLLALVLAFQLQAEPGTSPGVPSPGPRDLCAVCGMFVEKYPDWVASLRFQTGETFHFDGAKDLFKFLLDLPRYAPGKTMDQIQDLLVTEYYDVERIPAKTALFVIGSDVLGPMGNEFIPFRTKDDAEAFKEDHHGIGIVTFEEVDLALVKRIDEGKP